MIPTPTEVTDFPQDMADDIVGAHTLTVHNVLASASLSCSARLDLDKCCLVLGNSFYNPSEFPALRVDVRGRSNAIYTISLFESGRIQSTGGCRPMEARKAMMKIGRRLNEKFNLGLSLQNFEIQNVLAVFDACCPVNLGEFAATFKGSVDYEPDRFPAARVRIPIPRKKNLPSAGCSDDVDSPNARATLKLRKLMMGESSSSADLTQTSASAGVGSYIVGAGSKRVASSRQRDEKQAKEEIVTANVFSTGKITFTGAKCITSLNTALEKLKPAIGIRPNGAVGTALFPPTGFQTPFPMYSPLSQFPSSQFPSSQFSVSQFPSPYSSQYSQMAPMSMAPAAPGSLAYRTQQLALQEHQLDQQRFRAASALQQYTPLRTT